MRKKDLWEEERQSLSLNSSLGSRKDLNAMLTGSEYECNKYQLIVSFGIYLPNGFVDSDAASWIDVGQ